MCSSMAFATIEEKKASALKLLRAVELKTDRHYTSGKNMRKRGSVSTLKMAGDPADLSNHGLLERDACQNQFRSN